MSSATAMSPDPVNRDRKAPETYRALSTAAVASLVFGLASLVLVATAKTIVAGQPAALALPLLALISAIPLMGVALAWRALVTIRKMPEAYTGRKLALAGLGLSVCFLVSGLAVAGYTYATEVPSGYARLSFNELKPDDLQTREGVEVPPGVVQYDGQKVWIKGYMRPSSQKHQITSFLLVRDNKVCCFGQSLPAYYDQIRVALRGPLRTDYSTGVFRAGGVLRIHPENVKRGLSYPVFTLEADYLK